MAESSRVMIKDIAARTGVSLTTVSRVLRGQGVERFSDETCRRIRSAATEMGWRPNLLVRGIQTGITQTLGVMIPPFDSYWAQVLYGIHDQLVAADHVPILLWTRPPDSSTGLDTTELTQLHRLVDRRVDGIIAWPLVEPEAVTYLTDVAGRRLPVVTIDWQLPAQTPHLSLQTDEAVGARLIVDHLQAIGKRTVAHITTLAAKHWAVRRHEALVRELHQKGMELSAMEASGRDRSAVEAARRLLESKSRPDAIVAATDHAALGVYQAAQTLGIGIPRDLAVIGYGNLSFELPPTPRLTTLDQRPYYIGERAAQQITQRESLHRESAVRLELIAPRLLVRGSSLES